MKERRKDGKEWENEKKRVEKKQDEMRKECKRWKQNWMKNKKKQNSVREGKEEGRVKRL